MVVEPTPRRMETVDGSGGRRRHGAQGSGRRLDDMLKILLVLSAPSTTLVEKWPASAKRATSITAFAGPLVVLLTL